MSSSRLTQKLAKISIPEIVAYATCPKKFEYAGSSFYHKTGQSVETKFIKTLIQHGYINRARTGLRPSWRPITGLIDKMCFDGIDTSDDVAVRRAYKRSMQIIKQVQASWFKPYFLDEPYEGFLDLKLERPVWHYLVTDIIDLVLFDEKELIVCEVTDVVYNLTPLYNSIRLRCQALLLAAETGKYPTKLRRITWSDDNISVQTVNISKPEEFFGITERVMRQILDGIYYKIFYPAINEQCLTCPFRKKCSF